MFVTVWCSWLDTHNLINCEHILRFCCNLMTLRNLVCRKCRTAVFSQVQITNAACKQRTSTRLKTSCEGVGWPQPKYSGLNVWLPWLQMGNNMLCFRHSRRSGVNEIEKIGQCQKAAQNWLAWGRLKNYDSSWNYFVYNSVQCYVNCLLYP